MTLLEKQTLTIALIVGDPTPEAWTPRPCAMNALKTLVTHSYGNFNMAHKYNSKEWGVFAARSRCWVMFGTKKRMVETANRLNKLEEEIK